MRRLAARFVLALALAAPACADATCFRIPQIPFASSALQGFLNTWDGGVNTLTDQLDAPVFASTVSGNADYTFPVKLDAVTPGTSVGLYNTADPSQTPALVPVFPASALAGWIAVVNLRSTGNVIVTLFDENAVFVSQTTTTGPDRRHFGFYVQSAAGVVYSQDARNGSAPQVLTYAGTGPNALDNWLCFAASPFAPATSHFVDAVLDCEYLYAPCGTTPVRTSTWGQLKAAYR